MNQSSSPLDLDSIISQSNSVDDMVQLLNNAVTAQKVTQVAGLLDSFKKSISPGSTAGQLNLQDAYRSYYLEQVDKGAAPMQFKDWIQQQQQQQDQQKSNSKSQKA